MDGLRKEGGCLDEFGQAMQIGFVLAALKGHERDALLALALSLAGRQLGDLRLSGLRMVASLVSSKVYEEELIKRLDAGLSDSSASLEDLIRDLSKEYTSNFGNRLQLDDEGDPTGGEWTYKDPEDGLKP